MEAEFPKLNNSFMAKRYNYANSLIKRKYALIKKANLKDLNKDFTIEDVKHAYIALASRNFVITLENQEKRYNCLAPYTDMFNFNPETNTEWTERLDDENGFFRLRASEEIEKEKEIFVFYREDDNQELLFSYGFTLENNPYKLITEYFIYTHNGKNYYATLSVEETNKLIDIVEKYRRKNNVKLNIRRDKEKIKKADLEVFKSVLESLKKYSDKGRIEEYKKNEKKNPNYINIYRALLDEDSLIEENSKYLKDIIQVLEGGKQTLKEKAQSKVVMQNKKYFEDLLL